MTGLRVVVADDHALVRAGIRALLSSHGMDVVGEAGDGRTLLDEVRKHTPDVAVIDIAMPLLDGIEATRRVSQISCDTKVVILSMHVDERFIDRARRAGAKAYVLKDEAEDRLIRAIQRVAKGMTCLTGSDENADEALTPREREVLQLIVEGKKNREIAEVMCRSVHTVRSHRARLMRKLRVRSAGELVRAAERLGLVPSAVDASGPSKGGRKR